jgi:hypothetical protein
MPTDRRVAEYDAQARIISNLNEEVRSLRIVAQRAELEAERYKGGYDFYMLIQKACQESPVVAGEFQRFLMTCKLVEENETGTPGLTAEDDYPLQYGLI